LISFSAALFVGLHAGNPLVTVLFRALFIMLASYLVGLLVGAIAQHTVQQHIENYKQRFPIPERGDLGMDAEDPGTSPDPSDDHNPRIAA
jgi:hypothetical protein